MSLSKSSFSCRDGDDGRCCLSSSCFGLVCPRLMYDQRIKYLKSILMIKSVENENESYAIIANGTRQIPARIKNIIPE